MSLHHLIELARRTGDRLIVHDPVGGRDIVIMSVDAYERLLDREPETQMDDNDGDDIWSWREDDAGESSTEDKPAPSAEEPVFYEEPVA